MDLLTANDRQGAYPASYYAATATPLDPFPTAKGAIACDVCVVGGGYSGLSAALHLAQAGMDVVLLDAQRVGFGASGRNGGQVGTGQRIGQDDLEKIAGLEHARALWGLSLESVHLVRDLIAKHDMACGWSDGIIEADHRAKFVPHSHAYADKLRTEYDYDLIRPIDREEMRSLVGSPAYHGGTLDMGGGHLHPLRYALGLARAAQDAGVRIFENSKVIEVKNNANVTTQASEINAQYVVMGCNGYLGALNDTVATRVMPINNFIAATAPLDDPRAIIRGNHAVADSKFVINYFRLSDDDRLLFGGGESYGYRFPRDIAATVRKPMSEIFPQLKEVQIDYAWGGTLGITMNRLPHFARLSDRVLSISGYSGHGVAMATLGGKLAAEAVQGQAERFDLFSTLPSPRFPGGPRLRTPLLALAMIWYSLRDRL
ncbi:NAD(P)/FAD-dependent oxidoreductase [Pseudooctadecabacter jejudonensis]|uniref:Gamma-glutamylputrescine oxidoreductase n=1 Tax=Pseudooctadecabacter jejudonensis TaxID=1391910 RepID=A0A1Y5RJE7_9RHOB|nr:FAD-binding oxidoreductase [Pseudooctadecabacter jejudonensis]SLN16154.1 Gamma-glutamylputrescine oxidoreductase [Pseudooctadecabacter jejudonensis]